MKKIKIKKRNLSLKKIYQTEKMKPTVIYDTNHSFQDEMRSELTEPGISAFVKERNEFVQNFDRKYSAMKK